MLKQLSTSTAELGTEGRAGCSRTGQELEWELLAGVAFRELSQNPRSNLIYISI